MPRVGSSKKRMSQSRVEPFGDDDLLLIAAREEPHFLRRRRRPDVEQLDELVDVSPNCALAQEKPNDRNFGQVGHDDVRCDVHADGEAEALAVLRQVADAGRDGIARAS